jgi:hypothetical protein
MSTVQYDSESRALSREATPVTREPVLHGERGRGRRLLQRDEEHARLGGYGRRRRGLQDRAQTRGPPLGGGG